ncbi:hypothetical protein MY10362_009906, partial [Beauveria mimosiformis]
HYESDVDIPGYGGRGARISRISGAQAGR